MKHDGIELCNESILNCDLRFRSVDHFVSHIAFE